MPTMQISFGEYLKTLREDQGLPLRKIAAKLDLDPSTLSKIERGERFATSKKLPLIARVFNVSEESLRIILLSDKIAYQIKEESNSEEILKVAELKIKYFKGEK